MLLIHQAGSVKVGEVVRYTLTYTPSADRILPSASHLHVRIKNSSAIPYRAAYLHGPYTLHVSTYPSSFNPNKKLEQPRRDGIPEFEPNLKAGGHFHSKLVVPEDIREHGEEVSQSKDDSGKPKSMTWIIEIASQILFSNNASVNYEIIVGRDERSLELGFAAIAAKGYGGPGRLEDHAGGPAHPGNHTQQPKRGVYSGAVDLVVEDTATLWNKPALPTWDDQPEHGRSKDTAEASIKGKVGDKQQDKTEEKQDRRPQKKIHLVVLTHGLHSNIGADMLYMKESIDATAREARQRGKDRRASKSETTADGSKEGKEEADPTSTAPLSGGQEEMETEREGGADPDDEQVIVRGFTGNATRTERGIQFLGKRLAKFVLQMTYPDQPYLPVSKSLARSMTGPFSSRKSSKQFGSAAHAGSSIYRADSEPKRRPYKFTSISFIGHSLGGLIQTYAIAYIQKHSPGFFDVIKPINFIAMASPMLGLSNENPMYVKFALDFGLVGRTGQDLGLTWRPPTIARNGWASMLSSFGGNNSQEPKADDPRAKPLLRILPTGPAHQVLKQFRNRTLYSNVVNDGIVPLRTSCLLFLDWRGLGRVENARRDNGLLATLASTGWAELTGANSVSHRPASSAQSDDDFFSDSLSPKKKNSTETKASKSESDVLSPALPDRTESGSDSPKTSQFLDPQRAATSPRASASDASATSDSQPTSAQTPLDQFFGFFKPASPDPHRPRKMSSKAERTYRRAQIIRKDSRTRQEHSAPPAANGSASQDRTQSSEVTRGSSMEQGPPPKTSVFDAAADILNPPIPPLQWLLDPSSRDRTIFHDRVYHPEDIPPPPVKRPRLSKSKSVDSLRRESTQSLQSSNTQASEPDTGGMRVEEKIARAYHHNISWRKVLVRLEPDAHNNMIVRRMFANAYGWDVVKHLCDTHFSDSFSSKTRDEDEANNDRALPADAPTTGDANQVKGQTDRNDPGNGTRQDRTMSELAEVDDEVKELAGASTGLNSMSSKASSRKNSSGSFFRQGSAVWDDKIFEGSESEGDSDTEEPNHGPLETFMGFWNRDKGQQKPPKVDTNLLSAEPKVAAHLTQSPSSAEPTASLDAVQTAKTSTDNVLSPAYQAARVGDPLHAEQARPDGGRVSDERPQSGDTTKVGLQKTLEQEIGHNASDNSGQSKSGITEQVAKATEK